MSLDGVYVPTERAPAPEPPSRPAPPEPPPAEDGGAAPTVFLPTERMHTGDQDFEVEMRHLVDGRLALLTYSSLAVLVESCGEYQPWVEVPEARVADLLVVTGADTVVADQPLDAEQRHGPEDTG